MIGNVYGHGGRKEVLKQKRTEDAVILTGGYNGSSVGLVEVTKYDEDGKATNMPDLITGRYNHACGKFTNRHGETVSSGS